MLLEVFFAVTIGTLWSLFSSTVIIPAMVDRKIVPNLMNKIKESYSDPEWIESTFGKSWEGMAEVIAPKVRNMVLGSLNGSALRDIRTISENTPEIQNEILSRLPAELPPAEALKMLKIFAKKPGLADTLTDLMEGMSTLQGLGMMGDLTGNGGEIETISSFHPMTGR